MEPETKTVEVENTPNNNSAPSANTENTASAVAAPEETQEQINWRRFREAREKERKEKLEAEKRAAEKEAEAQALKAALDALVNKPSKASPEDSYYPTDERDEDKIQKLIEEGFEKQRKRDLEEKQRREQEEFPQKLTSTFTDFNHVCTQENLDYFEYHYPEVAAPFKHMPDGYEKWAAIYKAVKRFVPNTDSKKDQSKAEKNFSKPQSMSIAGKTQVGDTAPIQLDEKRKMDNWSRMQRVMRGG